MGKKWAERKRAHRNTRRSTSIVMDSESADEAERLAGQLDQVPEAERLILAARIQDLEQQAAESTETFVFESIGRGWHELLLADHPATAEQQAEMPEGRRLRWNPETFEPALLAACCVEPVELHSDIDQDGRLVDQGAVAEWAEIRRDWNDGQWRRLWDTCLQAVGGVMDEAPKSVAASALLAGSARI